MANWDHCLRHAALTDVGLRRANNQDAMTVVLADGEETFQRRGHLFIVADGMGAHAAGELASKLSCDTIALTYSKLVDKAPPEAILAAVHEANAKIHRHGQANLDFKGMGTTTTSLLILQQGALLAQVGDSRAYRLRGEHLEQLTFDHSLVWEMRAAGQLPEDKVPDYVPKNIITRSLGPNAEVKVDLEGPFPIEVGDTFALCSDGLSGPVKDDEIGTILRCLPPDEAARALVDLANLRGGPDNITCIVVQVTGPLTAGEDDPQQAPATPATRSRPINPLLLTALVASAMLALGAAAMKYWMFALGCLGVSAISGLLALVQRNGGSDQGFVPAGRPLGKGPYTACDCPADQDFIDRTTEIVEQLRQAAMQEDWQVDWHSFNALLDRAGTAERSGDRVLAVGESFRAISFMMSQLKDQRDTGSDGSIFDR